MATPVLIVGTGALATLFAVRLAQAGAEVTMLGTWQAAIDALNQRGALLEGGTTEQEQARLPEQARLRVQALVLATKDPARVSDPKMAIVLVKTWQTERVARQLASCLAPDGVALTLQNGLGNAEILAAALGTQRVAVGVTTTGAALIEPGYVRYGGSGSIDVRQQENIQPLVVLLRKAGFSVSEHTQVNSLLWGKLVINSAINPLTALLGVRNGALLEDCASRDCLRQTALESARVAAAAGIRLPFDDPIGAVEAVASRTANNDSSMLQDLRRGAPTEIDAINGAVIRAAHSLGLAAPQNELLRNLIISQVRRRSAGPVEIFSYRRSVG